MLSEHERYRGLGMNALVIVCSRNTNVLMVWACMHWQSYARGTRAFLWLGNGCTCYRMFSEHERYNGLGMDALVIVCSRNTNVIMVWEWMHLLSHALGTRTLLWFGHDALVILCSRNTNVILVWEWLHYLSYALLSYASEHEHYYGLGMDAR